MDLVEQVGPARRLADGCCPFARSLLDGHDAHLWRRLEQGREAMLDGTFWRFPCCEELGNVSSASPPWVASLQGRITAAARTPESCQILANDWVDLRCVPAAAGLVLILGDSLAYELALALLCKVERHTSARPATLLGHAHLLRDNATAAGGEAAQLASRLWPDREQGPRVLARYADGTTVLLGSLPRRNHHLLAHWPRMLAASSWRETHLVLLGGGAHHLAAHWTCPGTDVCPLPSCAIKYATQGKRGWFNVADDPTANRGRCAAEYERLAEAWLGGLLNATHHARGVSATLVLQPPAAFPTASGEYHSALPAPLGGGWSNATEAQRAALAPKLAAGKARRCFALNSTPPGLTNERGGDHWRNGVLRALAERHRTRLADPLPLLGPAPVDWHVGRRPTYSGEWDARRGAPAFSGPRTDCLHWCMHDRVWAPLLELIFRRKESLASLRCRHATL